MSRAAIISIKPVYAQQILAGTKTIELRRSSMGLSKGDIVVVYVSAPEQQLGFWFKIEQIETLSVDEMWRRQAPHLGIDRSEYLAYFQDSPVAVGLYVGELRRLEPPIPLGDIEELVPGFVPPQGLIWLRDEIGRYRNLLPRFSAPLPREVFPQQALPW